MPETREMRTFGYLSPLQNATGSAKVISVSAICTSSTERSNSPYEPLTLSHPTRFLRDFSFTDALSYKNSERRGIPRWHIR